MARERSLSSLLDVKAQSFLVSKSSLFGFGDWRDCLDFVESVLCKRMTLSSCLNEIGEKRRDTPLKIADAINLPNLNLRRIEYSTCAEINYSSFFKKVLYFVESQGVRR